MLIRNTHIEVEERRHMRKPNSILFGSIIDLYLNQIKKRMKLNETILPDKRKYETFDSPSERNIRFNELKNR